MDGYPIFVRVTDKVRDELIIGNNADQIGATPHDEYKEALVRDPRAIVIRNAVEHECIIMMLDDHIDRAADWGFEMQWFARSAQRIMRELLQARHEAPRVLERRTR